MFSRVTDFFKSIFNDFFGVNVDEHVVSMNDTLNEIIEKVGDKVAFGKGSALSGISSQTKSAIRNTRKGSKMNYTHAKQFLIDRGFIKIVCT